MNTRTESLSPSQQCVVMSLVVHLIFIHSHSLSYSRWIEVTHLVNTGTGTHAGSSFIYAVIDPLESKKEEKRVCTFYRTAGIFRQEKKFLPISPPVLIGKISSMNIFSCVKDYIVDIETLPHW